jgi:hypothetical protein
MISKNYLFYSDIGEVMFLYFGDKPEIQALDLSFIECNLEVDRKKHYVLNNIVTDRPTQATTINKLTITADGIDAVLITNAPDGIFTAINRHTEEEVSGAISGSDTFATTIAGTYQITISSFPYLDFTATIEAT